MPIQSETELYQPIKEFLEHIGYEVKAEVKHCDMVAVRAKEEPVIIELKKTFILPLLIQGMTRLKQSDHVYLAIEHPKNGKAPYNIRWRDITQLCQMIGLGLISVRFYKRKKPLVQILCEPNTKHPKKSKKSQQRLMGEFSQRSGDYNVGGSSKRKIITSYREQVLQCARLIKKHGTLSIQQLKESTGNAHAAQILQKNYYQWFERVSRGVYKLTALGEKELSLYDFIPLE